jgi:MATE family multidrug resistance protein
MTSSYSLVERGESTSGGGSVIGLNEIDDELKEDQSSDSSDEAPSETYDEHGFIQNDDELDTWPPLSKAIFRGWWEFLKIGIPSALSVFIEGGSWEVNAAITAHLVPAAIILAGHSVLALTAGFWYVISIGVSVSAASLIGNALGANEPNRAKLYIKLCYVLVLSAAIANGGIGMFYRRQWATLFSSDIAVINLAEKTMWVMWLYTTCDALKAVGMSLLRSCGRALPTVFGNFFSCLIAGYPISWALAFPAKLGLFGIWVGMSFAWLSAGSIYAYILYHTNWQTECDTARERNAIGSASMKSPVKEKKHSSYIELENN